MLFLSILFFFIHLSHAQKITNQQTFNNQVSQFIFLQESKVYYSPLSRSPTLKFPLQHVLIRESLSDNVYLLTSSWEKLSISNTKKIIQHQTYPSVVNPFPFLPTLFKKLSFSRYSHYRLPPATFFPKTMERPGQNLQHLRHHTSPTHFDSIVRTKVQLY